MVAAPGQLHRENLDFYPPVCPSLVYVQSRNLTLHLYCVYTSLLDIPSSSSGLIIFGVAPEGV
jgi:hypothetical protein